MRTIQKSALGALALGLSAIVAFNHPIIAQSDDRDDNLNGPHDRPRGDRPPGARPPRPPGPPGPSPEQLSRMLDLTPEQQKKVKAIFDKTRAEMEQLHEKSRKQIDAVLTPAQRTRMEQLRAQHGPPGGPPHDDFGGPPREGFDGPPRDDFNDRDGGPDSPRGPRGHHPPPRGPSVEELTRLLNLTAEQQTKIKAILDKSQTSADAIRDNEALSREERRDAMQRLHEDTRRQVDAVLTPQQLEKMRQLHEQHRPPHGPPPGPPPEDFDGPPGDEPQDGA